ncbi:class I SAM-dependent methyltransferase [Pseudohalocynthiibacter aestuariivivens]|jgi:ubiquinone/menaquinone biosynthesis C-methylase UbiE|uniref:Class I SAM-dependent methyltransferase n=1 Tax=Pseudohalocynthiibacter aestuariivivens TaxID=1591409 RepID=A0ABV5JDT1_9RHOB|nr:MULTISPECIES: methyltransferase domain-containing protein [Pseudohalocynthiibacter]MBS9718019.1 methyltransferase domain-containing protein [Pseudohalocynthiibacter aestuariivivens]MCK0103191.1 methyltransferase domain-containing protein [Pseudohalocynthiibacter sp. F2068]
MAGNGEHKNESIWDSAAPGWAKWESALMGAAAEATEQMLDAANVEMGMRVLDLACGAGSQTIQAARRVGPTGRVFANDIASKMLTFVTSNTAAAGLTNVETLHGPAEDLSKSGLHVDAATCRLGLMLFQSPQDALAAVRSVLAENGRFAVLVVASPQDNLLFSKTMMIALKHAGKTPPPPGSPGLFALSDPARLESLFQAAGYIDTRIEQVAARLSIASIGDALTMMQEAFGAYRAVLADLDDKKRDVAWAEIRDCIEQFSNQGGVSSDMTLLLASGTNPPA